MFKLLTRLVASCLFLLFVCIPVSAQASTATLSGTIEDENGAVIPGAKVTVTLDATAQRRHATTNESGSFTILLPPGEYTVLVEREGFTRLQLTNIILNVGDQKAVQVQLKVGDIASTVEVRPDATLVRTDGSVGTVVDRTFVENIPLNGRSFQSLILLTPGVVVTPASDISPGQFSVNGQRGNANNFTIDGVSGNTGVGASLGNQGVTQVLAGTLPALTAFGGTNSLVSIDALEEFKIETSTYSAEYGRQPGGQISIATRSGTNQFHGSLFDFVRNDVFDANDWFANAAGKKKAALRQNMFGGTFSGPIHLSPSSGRDSSHGTFFFFSYEGLRLRLPQALVTNVPSLRLRQLATSAIRPLLDAFPLPDRPELLNSAGAPSGIAQFTGVYSDPSRMNATSVRLDHSINSRATLFGRVSITPSRSSARSANGLSQIIDTDTSIRSITLGTTALLPHSLSNDFRFNYTSNDGRNTNRLDNFGGAIPISPSAIIPNLSNLGGVVQSVVQVVLPVGRGGLFSGPSADIHQRQFNIIDNVSVAKGEHGFKFGIDYRRLAPEFSRYDYLQNVLFNSETQIRNGTVALAQVSTSIGSQPQFTNVSIYGQDSWRATQRLVLNLGLRWEINPAPTEATGKQPVAIVGVSNLPTATLAPPGTPIYKTYYGAVAPRVGIAYQLSQKNGWERAIRGGFGVYYDLGSGQATIGFLTYPFFVSNTFFNVPFPLSAAQSVPPNSPTVTLPITSLVFAPNPDLKLPYTLQWNVSVEQSLGANQTVSASYVGAAGRELLTTQQLNQRPTGSTVRPNPNFSNIAYASNGPTSNFHSLQLQFRRRLTRGMQALVNYTWAHSIDEVSDEASTAVLDRGNSDFDIRHNFSAAITYNLPFPSKRFNGVLGGWSIDSIIHAQSAAPLNVVAGSFVTSDGRLINVRPDVIENVPLYVSDINVAGGRRFNPAAFRAPTAGRQGSLGRNVLRGLPLYQVDVAVRKKFSLREKLTFQLRGEVFNLFNHPNFGGFGTTFSSPATFGVPNQMLGRSLGGLSSLYQLGGPRSLQFSLRIGF